MSTNTPAALPSKTLVPIGNRGIAPSTMDDLYRFASAVAKSGLAPKGIETPEAIFVALEMGLEIGLPMMAALQNIAVINGRPAIWGDAQLAVVRGTGELDLFEEWYEEKGKRLPRNPSAFTDDTTAVCRVQRHGYEPAETAFSVADAKRANLWGKSGPWTQYPARMLRHRARSFALRDQFGDALRGLRTVEEVQDDPVGKARNVTPPLFQTPEPAPVSRETAAAEPIVEAAEASQPDPIRQRDLDAVEEVKAANYAKIAQAEVAEPSPLDLKRLDIRDAFTSAGLEFAHLKAFLLSRGLDLEESESSWETLSESVVGRLTKSKTALASFVSQAAKVGGAE
jgi:hypothetical protein